jgi:undecaprenyl diphosphate synthase
MWPDFEIKDLDAALKDFSGRERRFGGVPESSAILAAGGAR